MFPAIYIAVINLITDLSGCQEQYTSSPSSFSTKLECGNNTALANRLENLMSFVFITLITIPSGLSGLIFLIVAQIMSLSIRKYRSK